MLEDPTKSLLVLLDTVGAMEHQTLIGHDVTPCWRNHRLRTGLLADTQRQGIKTGSVFHTLSASATPPIPSANSSTDSTKDA